VIVTTIPFSGFYHSMWNEAIEDSIEYEASSIKDQVFNDNDAVTVVDVKDAIYEDLDLLSIEKQIAMEYTDRFSHFVARNTGVQKPLEFRMLISPCEYIFVGDKLVVYIRENALQAIYEATDREHLDGVIWGNFKIRDGLIPRYSDRLSDWEGTPFARWDTPLIEILMRVWLEGVVLRGAEGLEFLIHKGMLDEGLIGRYVLESIDRDRVKKAVIESEDQVREELSKLIPGQ